jgi:glycosyltransferase involved in cell wall biosynthesis
MRKRFSVCIPAYNRARHLPSLLDSILAQEFTDFEIVICEDLSRERDQIRAVVQEYRNKTNISIRYNENEVNLGYDGNIRRLIDKSAGEYCFFMGNDDLMRPSALAHVDSLIQRNPGVGVVVKAYEWFMEDPNKIVQTIRYVKEEKSIEAGERAIVAAFRRAGVISGFIIHRDEAAATASANFDGSLYYQMYITGRVLVERDVVFTPEVLVCCRGDEPPEFGASKSEKGKYVPGKYTPEARVNMISGALNIAKDVEKCSGLSVFDAIAKDYANYFYPYIRDQLNLSLKEYLKLYLSFCRLGFWKYSLFHVYMLVCYLVGEKGFDNLTNIVRGMLGRTPRIGNAI